jgi:cytochrome c-type biogenesis protein CcmH/NrfG
VALTALALALIFGVGYGVYQFYLSRTPRTVKTCVVTDFGFRYQRPNWRYSLGLWFAEINRAFDPAGVVWEFNVAGDAYPTSTGGDLEYRKSQMVAHTPCKGDVQLGFTVAHENAVASVSPFSGIALVGSKAGESDAIMMTRVAHTLARLFGAPSDPRALLTTDMANEGIIDPASIRLVSQLRRFDFARGAAALPGKWERLATRAVTDAFKESAANPTLEAHKLLARAYADARMRPNAILEFRAAVRAAPDQPHTRLELALQLSEDGNPEEALHELREAAKLDPADARPHTISGVVYMNTRRYEEAVDELRAAIKLDPHQPYNHRLLGQALTHQMGGSSEAEEAFRAALKRDARDEGAVAGLTMLANAPLVVESELRALEREAQNSPNPSMAHHRLGLALVRAAEVKAAWKAFERAVQLDPRNGPAHHALARLKYSVADYPGAKAEMEQAKAAGVTLPTSFVKAVDSHLQR